MKKVSLLLLIILFVLQGCFFRKHPARYGTEFNVTREKLGINLLDSTWKVSHVEPFYTYWVNPNTNNTKAQYIGKKIFYFDDILSVEVDLYENNPHDGSVPERLAIFFYYRSSKYDKHDILHRKKDDIVGWDYRYTCDDGHEGVQAICISRQQADSIMQKWDLVD